MKIHNECCIITFFSINLIFYIHRYYEKSFHSSEYLMGANRNQTYLYKHGNIYHNK